MRKTTLLLFSSLLIFISCGSNSSNNRKSGETLYEEQVKSAFTNAESVKYEDTTFFLGFHMGMTAKQVNAHCAELASSGKLYKSNRTYKYNIKDSVNEKIDFQTELQFEYFNNELFELSLRYTGKNSKGQSYINGVGILFCVEFSQSWGKILEAQSYKKYIKKDAFGDYQYYFIKGNIIVSGNDSYYVFTDAYRDNLREQSYRTSVATDLANDFNL
jgi:hypothetical protein